MALKAVVEKLDDVQEEHRSLYIERGGKYELAVEIGGVEGVKSFTDFSKLQGALVKERADHKAIKDKFANFGDKDPAEVLAQLDRIAELEAAAGGKLDEAKLGELVEGRLKGRIAPIERERDGYKAKLNELEGLVAQLKGKEVTRTIHDNVRDAVSKSQGFQSTALDDVLLLADRIFEIDEAGNVVTRDNVGTTPGVQASVWLTEMQTKRPHWWGPSVGGGSGGGRTTGGGVNPWTNENWNMTEQGRIYTESPQRAEQLAKAAGTTIGGARPAPRKV